MPKLKENSIHTVTIDNYASTGQGIARVDGMAVLSAAPCEENVALSPCQKWVKPAPGPR